MEQCWEQKKPAEPRANRKDTPPRIAVEVWIATEDENVKDDGLVKSHRLEDAISMWL
jgi:hypothetical protein